MQSPHPKLCVFQKIILVFSVIFLNFASQTYPSMKNFTLYISALMLAASSALASTSAETCNVIPAPREISFTQKDFLVKSAALDIPRWSDSFSVSLAEEGISSDPHSEFRIFAQVVASIPGVPDGNQEAYAMDVTDSGVSISALSEKGIFWALQTLLQLMEPELNGVRLTECHITDWPAFPYRGYLMDVGRTFISMDELKREIENMAKFKMNVFHWHLTENQAWRLESRIYPELTDSANIIRQPGKFYTVEDAKELQRFAADHNVLLIPELDMPGHSGAFRRSFGHDMQSEEGTAILKDLMAEACETFADVPYLHIGTDEVGFTNPDFVPEMVRFVRDHGKMAASWNPGWKYAPGDIDLVTMWSYRGKPLQGTPSVDSRFHYINHFDTYADILALRRSNVYGTNQANDSIIGPQIAIWNDRYVDDEQSLVTQNNLYPSMLAMSEAAWRGDGTEYFDVLGVNMAPEGSDDFNRFADFERRLLHHKSTTLSDAHIPYVKQTNVKWRITDAFPNEGNLEETFPPETEGLKTEYQYNDSIYSSSEAIGAGIYLRHVWGKTIPAFYKDPKPNHTAYAYTWVYSPEGQTVGVQAETQNYSRSESDIPAPQGEWDFRKSRIWINDEPLVPPVWKSSHTVCDNETPLANENASARPVIPVTLNEGWNKVLIKLPIGEFSAPETRLVKWMFTFVFTTPDGSEAAPGLVYSPDRTL